MKLVTISFEQYLHMTSCTEKETLLSNFTRHQISEIFEINSIPYKNKELKKELVEKLEKFPIWTPTLNIQLSENWSRKWRAHVPEILMNLNWNSIDESKDTAESRTPEKHNDHQPKRRKLEPDSKTGLSKLSPHSTEEEIDTFLDSCFQLAYKMLQK